MQNSQKLQTKFSKVANKILKSQTGAKAKLLQVFYRITHVIIIVSCTFHPLFLGKSFEKVVVMVDAAVTEEGPPAAHLFATS